MTLIVMSTKINDVDSYVNHFTIYKFSFLKHFFLRYMNIPSLEENDLKKLSVGRPAKFQ